MFILCQECVLHYIIILIRISVGIYKEFKKKKQKIFSEMFYYASLGIRTCISYFTHP